ncbi:MAG: helix-turn-helix domain-containing protein [bacterium]|nr:helix-turn-helix domain-containing protein [bacterium]MDZ4295753.1 helix-turn-helix domain-containing protein [Patescibacteria group bacterium]
MPTHITREDRIALAALRREGHSQVDAARSIGKSPSAVSCELKRNATDEGTYHATHADALARRRRKCSKVGARKIENDTVLAQDIESLLCPLVSPEVVAHETGIAHETIYAWVERSRPDLKVCLPQRGHGLLGSPRLSGNGRASLEGCFQACRPSRSRFPAAPALPERPGFAAARTAEAARTMPVDHWVRAVIFSV